MSVRGLLTAPEKRGQRGQGHIGPLGFYVERLDDAEDSDPTSALFFTGAQGTIEELEDLLAWIVHDRSPELQENS